MKMERHLKCDMYTRLFPMIGCPMGQSSGSYAYNPLFEENGIDEIMWPVEIQPNQLSAFMDAAKVLGIKHFSLTMPHKSAIIPLLDEVDEQSRLFNSVNIVCIDENGKSRGTGMDGKGNVAAIKQAGVSLSDMHVMIIGAGSIVGVILLEMAKQGVRKVTLINRSLEKAQKLENTVKAYTDMEIECREFTKEELDKTAAKCDFLMQSTALGLMGYENDYEYLGFLDKLPTHAIVMENIVNPPHTTFVKKTLELGHKVIYGVDMMLGQVGQIFEYCYGFPPSDESLAKAKKSVYDYFKLK